MSGYWEIYRTYWVYRVLLWRLWVLQTILKSTCAWVGAWKVNGCFYSKRRTFFSLSRTIQMSNTYRGRCRKLPFESLTLKAISILLELLDICRVPQTWQVSEGDKTPRGLYKTQLSSPHLQNWAAAAIGMQRSFQEFFKSPFSKTQTPGTLQTPESRRWRRHLIE